MKHALRSCYLGVCAMLFLVLAAAAAAQPMPGHGGGYGKLRLAETLGLTAEQREQLACATPGRGRDLKFALFEEREKLNSMVRDKGVVDEAIVEQLKKVNALQAEFNSHRLEQLLIARRVLTDTQLQKLLELQREGMGPGLGGGPGRGCGRGGCGEN